VAKPLVEGIREAGFDRSLTWQGTADGFRSARWESLRALPLGGKGRSLSGRPSNCVSSCGIFGGGSADADESYEPLPALKRRLWRLLKAGNKLLRFTTQSE